jgi:hypothetical protein
MPVPLRQKLASGHETIADPVYRDLISLAIDDLARPFRE